MYMSSRGTSTITMIITEDEEGQTEVGLFETTGPQRWDLFFNQPEHRSPEATEPVGPGRDILVQWEEGDHVALNDRLWSSTSLSTSAQLSFNVIGPWGQDVLTAPPRPHPMSPGICGSSPMIPWYVISEFLVGMR